MISVRTGRIEGRICFRILVMMGSSPHDFPFPFRTSFDISCSDTADNVSNLELHPMFEQLEFDVAVDGESSFLIFEILSEK